MSQMLPPGLAGGPPDQGGGQLPPQLLAMLQGGGQDGEDESTAEGSSELDLLQDVMNDLPKLIAALKDPKDVENAITCLRVLAGIQTRLMQSQGSGGAQPPR